MKVKRGIAISRITEFFREAHLDEARAAMMLVDEIMARRLGEARGAAIMPKRKRRRTKAEIIAGQLEKQTAAAVAAAQG